MNQNTVIATLVVKGVITEAEGEKLSFNVVNVPQSTSLVDAISEVTKLFKEAKADEPAADVKKDTDTPKKK
jgi:hypothetical protein